MNTLRTKHSVAFAITLPWVCYTALMACLSYAESSFQFPARLHRVGGHWYNVPDLAFNLVALLGLIIGVTWSVRAAELGRPTRRRAARIAGILAASFFGPALATLAVFRLADDVDGILWIAISPILGLMLATTGIVIVAIKAWRANTRAA